MKKNFPHIILMSALLISVVAEYFSIFGISKLFSGAKAEVIFMAIALGLAKLIGVGAIQTYWKTLGQSIGGKILRIYLGLATIILIVVTTAGAYGFLASAYQSTANLDRLTQTKIDLLKIKKDRFASQLADMTTESKSMAGSLESLRKSLSTDNQYQYTDKRGNVLTQIQSTSKKGVQDQITMISGKKDIVDGKIERLNDSISGYDYRIMETEANSKTSSELGPLKYIAELTGYPMNKIVNIMMLLLVCVIDPLAIALVLTSQFAMKNDRWVRGVETRRRNKTKQPVKSPTTDDPAPHVQITEDATEGAPKVKTRRLRGKYKPRQKKVEHFDVGIDSLADPDGIFSPAAEVKGHKKRKIVENDLPAPTAETLEHSLDQKKKINSVTDQGNEPRTT